MQNVQVVTLSTTQLQELISEGLKQELRQVKKELKEKEEEKLLTREETADLLSIGLSTLSRWTSESRLPSYGMGGRTYYKRSEVHSSLIKLS